MKTAFSMVFALYFFGGGQSGFSQDVHALQSQLEKAHFVIEEQMSLIKSLNEKVDSQITETESIGSDELANNKLASNNATGSSEPELAESLALFQPFIGTWEINTEWSGGQKLWSKNEYSVGIGGNFVNAKTWAKDGEGEAYERYKTIFSYDKENQEFKSYGFTFDGTVSVVKNQVTDIDGMTRIVSQWRAGTNEIKQQVQTIDKDSYSWQVWSRAVGSSDDHWQEIMKGTWQRVE